LRPQKKPKPDTGKAKYEPTAPEKAALDRYRAGPTVPRIKVTDGKNLKPDHPDELVGSALLAEALGTGSADFMHGLISQLANAGSRGPQIDERALNFMLSVIQGIKPRDQLEAMLAAQMATIHMACMQVARELAHAKTIAHQDSAERALNKLARTFAMLLDAFKRYRTGGEQKVTVQHVSVSEGGQAIVGNVTQEASRTVPQKPVATTPALSDTRQQAMPPVEPPSQVLALHTRKKVGGRDGGQSSA